MSDPANDDLGVDAGPETDVPGPGGSDSVQELHRPLMDIMNDPVAISLDGTTATTPDRDIPVGQDSVQAIHRVLMREQGEPRDGFEPVPVWVGFLFGFLLLWGGYYLGTHTADFRGDVFDAPEVQTPAPVSLAPPEPEPQTFADMVKLGEKRYQKLCVSCHQPDGKGKITPEQRVPPLSGSEWVAGAEASPERMAHIVLFGLQGDIMVKGTKYTENMPAQGGELKKDYEIAAVIAYVRNSLGNKADAGDKLPITAAEVAAIRARGGTRGQMSAAELKTIPIAPASPKAGGEPKK